MIPEYYTVPCARLPRLYMHNERRRPHLAVEARCPASPWSRDRHWFPVLSFVLQTRRGGDVAQPSEPEDHAARHGAARDGHAMVSQEMAGHVYTGVTAA